MVKLPVPSIDGFSPVPIGTMVPFMEMQSAALAYAFGINYEYGKRKIKSMSNDTYNALTSNDIVKLTSQHTTVYIEQFKKQLPQVLPMQTEIFKQFVSIEKIKVVENIRLAKWVAANAARIIGGVNQTSVATQKELEDEFFDVTPKSVPTVPIETPKPKVPKPIKPKTPKPTKPKPTKPDETKAIARAKQLKLIAHYKNNVKLVLAIVKKLQRNVRNIKQRYKHSTAAIRNAMLDANAKKIKTAIRELRQQVKFLKNVTAGRPAY